jgi:hypothetical protein
MLLESVYEKEQLNFETPGSHDSENEDDSLLEYCAM